MTEETGFIWCRAPAEFKPCRHGCGRRFGTVAGRNIHESVKHGHIWGDSSDPHEDTIAAQETAIRNLKAEVAKYRDACEAARERLSYHGNDSHIHHRGDPAYCSIPVCVGIWAALAEIDAALKDAGDGGN